MDHQQFAAFAAWITERGLAGDSESVLLNTLCERLLGVGVPLARVNIFIDTLHPIHEGHVFRWHRDGNATASGEYGRTDQGDALERWRRSTFYRLLDSGESLLRRRLTVENDGEFALLGELRAEG